MVRRENIARAAELLRAEISAPVFGESAVTLLEEIEAIRSSAYAAVCELPASGLRVMAALVSSGECDRDVRRRRARAYLHCLRAISSASSPKARQVAAAKAQTGDWSGYYRWKIRRAQARWCLLKLTFYWTLYRMGYNIDIEDSTERLSGLL
jgi:hypothetical protein